MNLPERLAKVYFYDANGIWRGPGIEDSVRWSAVADVAEAAVAAAVAQERERCIAELKHAAVTAWTLKNQDACIWAMRVLKGATPTEGSK